MGFLFSIIKFFWLGFWLVLATLILSLPVVASALLGSTGNFSFHLTKVYAWIILWVTGCRPKIRGKEKILKGQSYIIISNHQSHYDALALVTMLGIQFRWVAKKELLRIPSVSTVHQGIEECAEKVKEFLEEAGFETQIIETKGHPVVFGEKKGKTE